MLFRLWESINSYKYDERMLQFLSRLSEMHVDPSISDPQKIQDIPDDAKSVGEGRPSWSRDDIKTHKPWSGLFKDGTGVGIFTDHEVRNSCRVQFNVLLTFRLQWHLIMCKCLASMGKYPILHSI
jgi:proteasome activator subunit 4